MKVKLLFFVIICFFKLNAQCWQNISAGGDKTIAIKADGKIWGWGDNSSGALGLGVFSGPQLSPVQSISNDNFSQISTGGNSFTIAIKTDGTLWSTGSNTYGFLGIGNYNDKNSFTQIGTDNNWVQISAGGSHVLAIKSNGTLWSWGDNSYGELGNESTNMSNIPIQVGNATDWKLAAAGGYYFSAAIKSDGTLWAWGNNLYGQLGNGSGVVSQLTPIQIGTETNWKTVSTGQYHILAIKNNGTLWSWGSNAAGELGIGNTNASSLPVQVGTAASWQKISAASFASYAIKNDGSLWSWGYNEYGQLGDGTTVQKNIPTQIGTDFNWQLISGSLATYYAAALKNDGSAWSWGLNNQGVLGDGTIIAKSSPVQISCPTLGLTSFETKKITISPNPSSSILTIEGLENDVFDTVSIYDISGKLILETKSSTRKINIQNLTSGLYLLKVIYNNETLQTKFIKN